ncbi:hypothetical protein A9G28_09390 [Gilliamella sp. Fer1-1]|jgi:DNA-binding transcriptional regulator YdaS (Cro superfamily)|uniref:transcriptional regulator n=1 Tax=unclassified Gilliamella TaxID=2685620 RepID=UPI00080E731F|nr:YdaS family helix-turn-helix protein [Gilliamella apicola]OCG15027.1 hypothetical protein A9G47_12560 [Gilliamella apicola]OCG24601.1 hypothetical protein A9G46_08365 [Gilliamella apicola]OCG27393.1 hypothetical protein A9G45_08455 [Gilliamella apicola]OCG39411.1 hypothetical protein A9G28_09390 [Gilliamella apicola]
MKNKAIEKAILLTGSQKKLADACGKTQTSVWKWLHGLSEISLENALLIEKVTNGAVTACDIKPDISKIFPPRQNNDDRGDNEHIK